MTFGLGTFVLSRERRGEGGGDAGAGTPPHPAFLSFSKIPSITYKEIYDRFT